MMVLYLLAEIDKNFFRQNIIIFSVIDEACVEIFLYLSAG
jgi:hypothetical protein